MPDVYRLIGPPGTGKTNSIARTVEAWVERDHYAPEDIVLTSFTRSAAAVLAGRVPVPRGNIATLHALAYRALGSPPLAEKGALADEWNRMHAHLPAWQVGDGTASEEDGIALPDADLGKQMQVYSLARAMLAPYGHPLWALCQDFSREWEAYKQETGSLDFADMLINAATMVDALPQPVLVIDEAQDLTPLLWELARQWGAKTERFLVAGDPAQCVYNFAGARPDELLAPLAGERFWPLATSYRLPPAIAAHAEGGLREHSGPMSQGREYAPDTRRGDGLVRPLPGTWRQPQPIVEEVLRQLEVRPHEAGERTPVMVLATCAYMLTPLLAELRSAGVAFANPYRRSNGAWNPLGAAAGAAGKRKSTARMVAAYAAGEPFAAWIDMLRADVFLLRSAKKQIADGVEGFEAMLRPEHRDAVEAHDIDWLLGHLLAANLKPAEYAAGIVRRYGAETLLKPPRVTVGTGHSVKGGEASVVIAMPDLSMAGAAEMYATRAGRDSAVRLRYVMQTRAADELLLCDAVDGGRALW